MIISRTPLRISFAGGGSDLAAYYRARTGKPGLVVSTAINKYIYITVNKKFDDHIRVSYSKTEIVKHVEDVEHNIIRHAMKIVGVEKGIEIVYMGDIPLGSAGIGLGSSSCLAVGVLNALYAYIGRHVSAEQLARDACAIEIDILKYPMGKQDGYIAAYGGLQRLQFNEDETVFIDPLICKKALRTSLNKKLLLFYTGVERVSSTILAEQEKNTPANLDSLDQMVAIAHNLVNSLNLGNYAHFGEMLHEGWLHKKKLSTGISNPIIDKYYDLAIKAGAVGGKILGAGGGGFLLLYCDEPLQERVRAALTGLKETPFLFEPQGSKIIYVSD